MYTLCMGNIFYGWYIWIYIYIYIGYTYTFLFYRASYAQHRNRAVDVAFYNGLSSGPCGAARGAQHASHANIFCKKRFFIKVHRVHFPHEPGHPLSPNPNIVIIQLLLLGKRHLLNLLALRHDACKTSPRA